VPDLNQILIHFAPELILTVGALALLIYDLVIRGRAAAQAWLAGLVLLAALAATLWLFTQPAPPQGIFEARNAAGEVVRAGSFLPDTFTDFFRLLSILASLLVLVSGARYMHQRTPYRGEFFALLLFGTLAINLAAGANDLIVIALSIEFLSITSYVLTGYFKHDVLSVEGALKYFLYGSITGAVMLFGLVLLYGTTATTSLPGIAAVMSQPASMLVSEQQYVIIPALLLITVGIGFKIALVPFHQWAPDAYQGAPTPVTAFLSVGPKAAGFAVLLRLLVSTFAVPVLSQSWLAALAGIAAITMVLGNVTALTQTNVKRMMAYSSIAQAGYMLIGLVSLAGARMVGIDPLGAVLVYLLAYLFTNLGAFAVIIAMDDAAGSSELSTYAGLMRREPFMAVALFIFFLSLIGIPPLAGFVGKFAVFGSAVAAGQVWLAVVGVLTGVISVGYYFRVAREMLFRPAPEGAGPIRMAPGLTFVTVLALVMVFAIGLLAGPFLDFANQAAAALTPLVAAAIGGG
jgi:NADH-quinone oxidoreductase subunit N